MSKNSKIVTGKQKKMMINALEAKLGNVTKAAKLAGIAPRTHYRWLKEDSNYNVLAESIKDIAYRNIKDNLIDSAMKKIEEGDSKVLNKMLGIFLKNLPKEMQTLNRYNDVPKRGKVKSIDKPLCPNMEVLKKVA